MRKSTAAVLSGMAAISAVATMGTGLAGATPAVPTPMFWSPGADGASALLTAQQMSKVTGTPDMEVVASSTKILDDSDHVSPAGCLSAYSPAEKQSYSDSNWTSVKAQLVANGEPGKATLVITQAVVSFDSDDAAGDYLTHAAKEWKSCAGTDLSVTTKDGDVMQWPIGKPSLNDDKTVMILPLAATAGGCERALAGLHSIVIDVKACDVTGAKADGQAQAVALAIAQVASAKPA